MALTIYEYFHRQSPGNNQSEYKTIKNTQQTTSEIQMKVYHTYKKTKISPWQDQSAKPTYTKLHNICNLCDQNIYGSIWVKYNNNAIYIYNNYKKSNNNKIKRNKYVPKREK